ncbi:hypothetical protein [Amycolatopsis regifaucium]|uniref:Uncharacterized protein n=1 Tax=Amycolatopsis regifaucium TaxID=546365 RepID=A0A154MRD7_9PSEU|nr:hypothetical protein [Amycolatopsis regifaucium]KZB86503.1 hypothetical protein AVL48_26010 [Amycolatopsis regifaucium]
MAIALAAVMAWAIRDWASYLDIALSRPSSRPAGTGHHAVAGGTLTPPPAIAARAVPNLLGITLLAAHVTAANVLLAAAAARRWVSGRIAATLVFATVCAVSTASATIPLAKLTVGDAISPGNTLSAAITVLQYSFVLALVVAATLHPRPVPSPPEGDRRVEQKRRDQTRFRGRCGADLSDETAGIRAL